MSDTQAPLIVEPLGADGIGLWSPVAGPEVMAFLQNAVPVDARVPVTSSSASVLSKGVGPNSGAATATGLVVGYVQSGKTLSFEAVAALARDNGFPLVIVVAGTSIQLLEQTTDRLRDDFALDDARRPRNWLQITNPSRRDRHSERSMVGVLEGWRDPSTPPSLRRTLLITVMKNHRHLGNLAALLGRMSLDGVPALVIDDEADQASLNNQASRGDGTTSSTYRRLLEVRAALPTHTYLQYTATPQAPLLVSIIDALSPQYVEVLTPGSDYIGGREFFAAGSQLVRCIPDDDCSAGGNGGADVPPSLVDAMCFFMVGVACGIHCDEARGNRSMLIHPSHRTDLHEQFTAWTRAILAEWRSVLALPAGDPDRADVLSRMRAAHEELTATVPTGLPDFDVVERLLPQAVRLAEIREINRRSGHATPRIPWRDAYPWILIGGQAMDRGFTVEGLTVTYMPRGIGVGNADTIQQRARFFGYRRSYLGYCRAYLAHDTFNAFTDYVEHEEYMHQQLVDVQAQSMPLAEWKRKFVLDTSLRPCRNAVIQSGYLHESYSNVWVHMRHPAQPEEITAANRHLVDEYLAQLTMVDDEGSPSRSDVECHRIARGVPLEQVLTSLLVPFRVTDPGDLPRNIGLLLQLGKALEESPDEECIVYEMSPRQRRERGLDRDDRLKNLFQGEAPVRPLSLRGTVYPGDRSLRRAESVTVQIHRPDLLGHDGSLRGQDVPILAVWIPERLSRGWVVQDPAVARHE